MPEFAKTRLSQLAAHPYIFSLPEYVSVEDAFVAECNRIFPLESRGSLSDHVLYPFEAPFSDGKTRHLRLIVDFAKSPGHRVHFCRIPGDKPLVDRAPPQALALMQWLLGEHVEGMEGESPFSPPPAPFYGDVPSLTPRPDWTLTPPSKLDPEAWVPCACLIGESDGWDLYWVPAGCEAPGIDGRPHGTPYHIDWPFAPDVIATREDFERLGFRVDV